MSGGQTALALDVGAKRIGVAVARLEVGIASPLVTLTNDETVWERLQQLVDEHDTGTFVVGLPRGLDGQETDQTRETETFMAELRARVGLPVHAQDEAATSLKAEEELKARKKPYGRGDIDALAATYILEDYLREREETDGRL